jgi:hypothetical protein
MPRSLSLPSLTLPSLLLLAAFAFAACDSSESDPDPTDSTPPALVSASSDGTSVSLTFNEALDPTTVTTAAFTVAPGAAVASASGSGTTATLVLAGELDDDEQQTYTVTANGVADAAGNVANGTSATFTFGGGGGTSGGSAIGAAYPNAGDSRLIFFNAAGDRFLVFNPVTGAVTDADDVDDVENGLLPLDDVGASASIFGEGETYFFSTDGDTFTNYERDVADFDVPASFEEEYDEPGYELNSIGAAVEGNFFASNSIILFNQNGTEWQLWQPEEDAFSDVFTFPSQFGNGQAPIPAVGAGVYREDTNQVYLFNRDGTRYTIWNGSTFTAAFDVSDLGDIEF